MVYAHSGNSVLEIELADNSSAEAFVDQPAQGNVVVEMNDYGNFEKTGSLRTTFPTNDTSFTTQPGDVTLYQGNTIVIYYDVNTWSFTRLGKVTGISANELRDILGAGNVTAVFSLSI